MIAADASVAVAAALPSHPAHELAVAALRDAGARIPAHAAVETYSVLTRLPSPNRASPSVALAYLIARFERPHLALPSGKYEQVLEVAAANGIAGGAVYDALVGASAAHAGAALVTLDRRAIRSYEAVGVDVELLA